MKLGDEELNDIWVESEIQRVTGKRRVQVRPHGAFRPGALYRNWHALFHRDSAPRACFRFFDESGVAIVHKLRLKIEQCKRCMGFNTTRGFSRAPAFWDCGSNMHPGAE